MLRPLLSFVGSVLLTALATADSPPPPPEFVPQQTAQKPAPFPVKMVDQGTFDPKLKGLFAPEGFKTELVADAPTIINPVGMTFAPDGTLFVLEWRPDPGREWAEFRETFRYRDGSTRAVTTMKKFTTDTVKVLKYNEKTKTYDKSEIVISEELPSSILWHDGWLYVSGRGTVRRYKQSKAGGRWDLRETIAQGFCGFHHHQVSGLTIGPDGWLYITSGDDDNFVEGSDGSRATVLRTGAIFRCLPDGSKMETFSIGYRNPYRDVAFDDKYNIFHTDNDQEDGSKFTGCRIMHVAEESDFGWRLREGARCCRSDVDRYAVAGELPGKLAPMIKTGRGSPAGVLIYNDTQLPKHYRGLLYYPDVFRKTVRAYSVAPNGSTFSIPTEFEFLKAEDPLFRPCQMVTGPDGAIYVCDWRTDSGGAGKLWGDGVNGRIYRMTWVGTAEHPAIPFRSLDTWAKVGTPQATLDAAAQGLNSPDATTRQQAQFEMLRRAKKNPDLIRGFFRNGLDLESNTSIQTRLLCLGGLQQLWNADVQTWFVELLKDSDDAVRRLAVEALGRNAKPNDLTIHEILAKSLTDDASSVRRSAALAIGRIGADGAADTLLNAWKDDDGRDAFLTDAYIRGLERLGKPAVLSLLTFATSGKQTDLVRVAEAFTAMRTPPAAEALPELLRDPHLPPAQRVALIHSYRNYQFDPPLSLDPLAAYLLAQPTAPAAVKRAGLEVLAGSSNLGGPKGTAYILSLLDAPEDEVRLAAIQAIEQGKLGQASAKLRKAATDDKRAVGERQAIVKAVRAIGDKESILTVTQILATASEPAVLKAEALRTLTQLDAPAARKVAEKFLDQPDPNLIAEAVLALGTSEVGAKLVGDRYLAKKLPKDLFPRVSEVLRKYPNNAIIAKLNGEVMKGGLILSNQPGQMDAIRKQVQTQGDAKRGRAIYLNTAVLACASCHSLEGIGGKVGPDLTRLWETMTLEKIIESMVEPSKEIKEGFTSYKAVTLDGQSYSGLKLAETAKEVAIREANGRDVRIDKKDLDEVTPSKLSLMPDNAISQLSYDQFIDLLAFLKSKKEQESLRGTILDYNVLVGVSGDLKAPSPIEKNPDLKTKLGSGLKWLPASADASGLLSLKPFLPMEPITAYTLAYVYSPKKQSSIVTLLTDGPTRVWVGGIMAFERGVPKLAPFLQEEKFPVELVAGWNAILLKTVTSGATHRVGLQFTGELLQMATVPDVK